VDWNLWSLWIWFLVINFVSFFFSFHLISFNFCSFKRWSSFIIFYMHNLQWSPLNFMNHFRHFFCCCCCCCCDKYLDAMGKWKVIYRMTLEIYWNVFSFLLLYFNLVLKKTRIYDASIVVNESIKFSHLVIIWESWRTIIFMITVIDICRIISVMNKIFTFS
jgi:hypothetical protein